MVRDLDELKRGRPNRGREGTTARDDFGRNEEATPDAEDANKEDAGDSTEEKSGVSEHSEETVHQEEGEEVEEEKEEEEEEEDEPVHANNSDETHDAASDRTKDGDSSVEDKGKEMGSAKTWQERTAKETTATSRVREGRPRCKCGLIASTMCTESPAQCGLCCRARNCMAHSCSHAFRKVGFRVVCGNAVASKGRAVRLCEEHVGKTGRRNARK